MDSKPIPLRDIERFWDGPMANKRGTRIRFAMWNAMELAASLSTGKSQKAILAALAADKGQFNARGKGRRK